MKEPKAVKIVRILETKVWIENGIAGDRYVVVQHEGHEPFTYATFHYNYAYTSNSGTLKNATELALQLGATEPVEIRPRELPKWPGPAEIQAQIDALQRLLQMPPQ